MDWDTVVEKLETGSATEPDALNSRTTWLVTVKEDGSLQTGAATRKGRNVTRDPRCSIASLDAGTPRVPVSPVMCL